MSSSSIPAAKRRRIEAANHALRKPFRSPMISRPKTASSGSPDANSTPGSIDSTASRRREGPEPAETPTKRPSGPPRRKARVSYGGNAAGNRHDEDDGGVLARMRTRRKEADEVIRAAERDLETAREAARIEAQSLARRPGEEIDAEMRELVEKWRAACRTAADELLGLIGDRVAGMGGAKAWRESRRRQAEFFRGFDEQVETGAERGERAEGSDYEEDETGSGISGDVGDGDPRDGLEGGAAAEETGEETVCDCLQ